MARPAALFKRSLIFAHRWTGVALSLLFLLWFASGIVMMYWTFPAVTVEDRLERLPTLEPGQIKVPPAEAFKLLDHDRPPIQVRLTSFDGRPVYRFGMGSRGGSGSSGGAMVYADDGSAVDFVDEAAVDRAAVAWARRPLTDATKAAVEEVDQWTVGSSLRTLRPLYKYSFSDGQQVYVNGDTAEVVQYTTTSSRFWAYLGAIPHWLYFTPLRKHPPEWTSFVVWTSLIGTATSVVGVVIGVWMLSPRKRYRHAGAATSVPYRGWKRWHTIVGLVFGVITTTWAFSGVLSMGPFPITQKLTDLTVPAPPARAQRGGPGGRSANLAAALRGRGNGRLEAFSERGPAAALAALDGFGAKELELTWFDSEPVYLATNGAGDTRIVPLKRAPTDSFGVERVMRVVRASDSGRLADVRVMHDYDAYYLDRRHEKPLPVVYVELNDSIRTRYYIDPDTARVVGTYTNRNWVTRWLYHGLHSLDFPWLYKYRPLWDIVVITLMLGGTALCVTSIVLTWRVLARKLAILVRARFTTPDEDLAAETGEALPDRRASGSPAAVTVSLARALRGHLKEER